MSKPRLTDATRGPARRLVTIVALVAVAVALITTVAMVFAALSIFPQGFFNFCFGAWLVSLLVIFGATRYLKTDDPVSK